MDEVEEIKRRIDIVDLVSSYLTLKKAGANYRALCPFHNEKTPSLMVSPEKQIFKCFGCNEGGDIFSFVMKMENLEFREALEMLAGRAGVKLERYRRRPEYQQEKDQKTRLFAVNRIAAQIFHKILLEHPSGKTALEYLKKRQITLPVIKQFQIGYAPNNTVVRRFLAKKGFSDTEIQNAGGPDRFYRRIIFPIRDVMGNVLGFTGRIIDPKMEPKYLNTPETTIFHKGRILYNLDLARGEIKLAQAAVVAEGQMDVIASYQAGVKNTVASSGTALTPEHLQILFRYSPNIIFAFDADNAGLATSKKAYEMAIAQGMNVKMVSLTTPAASPAGEFKDPGEMIEKDPALWQKAVGEAKSVIDWYFQLANGSRLTADGQRLTAIEKKEIAKEILPVIKKIPDAIEQAHYVGLLAKRLGVSEQIIFDALGRVKDKETNRQIDKETKRPSKAALTSEEILLGIAALAPQKLGQIKKKISTEDFADKENRQLYSEVQNWYNQNSNKDFSAKALWSHLAQKIHQAVLERFKQVVLTVENQYPPAELNSEIGGKIIDDVCVSLKSHQKEAVKQHYAEAIKEAEAKGDREKLKALIKEFQDAISQ